MTKESSKVYIGVWILQLNIKQNPWKQRGLMLLAQHKGQGRGQSTQLCNSTTPSQKGRSQEKKQFTPVCTYRMHGSYEPCLAVRIGPSTNCSVFWVHQQTRILNCCLISSLESRFALTAVSHVIWIQGTSQLVAGSIPGSQATAAEQKAILPFSFHSMAYNFPARKVFRDVTDPEQTGIPQQPSYVWIVWGTTRHSANISEFKLTLVCCDIWMHS